MLIWKNKYNAHEDSIYQIISKNNQTELISVGEDGEVKIWGKLNSIYKK